MNSILIAVFLFTWYPALWLTFFIIYLLGAGEEGLEHNVMTDRENVSQNLGGLLFGNPIWGLVVLTFYVLALVIGFFCQDAGLTMVFSFLILAPIFAPGQVYDTRDWS